MDSPTQREGEAPAEPQGRQIWVGRVVAKPGARARAELSPGWTRDKMDSDRRIGRRVDDEVSGKNRGSIHDGS